MISKKCEKSIKTSPKNVKKLDIFTKKWNTCIQMDFEESLMTTSSQKLIDEIYKCNLLKTIQIPPKAYEDEEYFNYKIHTAICSIFNKIKYSPKGDVPFWAIILF